MREKEELDEIRAEIEQLVTRRMLGAVFFVVTQILNEGVCTASELNRGAKIGLKWARGPIDLMMMHGKAEVIKLVVDIESRYGNQLKNPVNRAKWNMECVTFSKAGSTATITMSSPENLNVLNQTVVAVLDKQFGKANLDPDIRTIVITGMGKAFVAGADIKFFLDNMKKDTVDNIVDFTRATQEVFEKIDKSTKTVVAILNGLTLGGGLELALCADVILGFPSSKIAFPETGIGIYPGLGGIQRSQKRLGKGAAKYMIYTGAMLNANDAKCIGLLDAIVSPEDVATTKIDELIHTVVEDRNKESSNRFNIIRDLFETYSLGQLLNGAVSDDLASNGLVGEVRKKIMQKAPLALKVVERLIDEAKGCSAELEEMASIFKTSDALLGLSSIGKRVEFQGK